MRQTIEWLIFDSGVTRYRISKDTGISENTLANYAKGTTDIGSMSLDNAEILYNYAKQIKKELK